MKIVEFKQLLAEQGTLLYRDMPWRRDTRPYYIFVSELMLQQTQVSRVIPKFEAFIQAFPDELSLATASLGQVLELWQGLGYNRRAKYLHEAAKQVVREWNGEFPSTIVDLQALPGIGPNTAGAIMAYAYNQPIIFIETNVRTVYFTHFFTSEDVVTDQQLREILTETMDQAHPREFYWSLMDYGSFLKASGVKNIHQSAHYSKQSPLQGSIREVRGQIVKVLVGQDMTDAELRRSVHADERFDSALTGLLQDGLISKTNQKLHLTK